MSSERVATKRVPQVERAITCEVNGVEYRRTVSVRTTLVDFLRQDLGLTGTHVGCEQGVCGACTVLVDGRTVRSCLTLAVQADRQVLRTVEGLASAGGDLHPLQQAFWDSHGLQCGFCTPGVLMTAYEYLLDHRNSSRAEIRYALAGNLCRCTGYQQIVDAVHSADQKWER